MVFSGGVAGVGMGVEKLVKKIEGIPDKSRHNGRVLTFVNSK